MSRRTVVVRSVMLRLLFAAWVVALSILGAALLAFHLVALPAPSPTDPRLTAAIDASRTPADAGRWLVLHVLYARCQCSQRILDHLRRDRRPPDVVERIVIVDDPPGPIPGGSIPGFAIESMTTDELVARYHVEAAPLLIVVSPDGAVRYAGGYTESKQGNAIHDLEVISAIRRGTFVSRLPLFGCAVSAALSRTMDPLGLKSAPGVSR